MIKKHKYLFSIIIPVYKTEDFLIRCLESLLIQDKHSFEIIIVNDGSPGECRKLVDSYIVNNNNIVYIEKENGGLSSARNIGVENASGEYCCFVDSDDYVSKNYIDVLKKNVEKQNPIDLLIFGLRKVDGDKLLEVLRPEKLEIVSSKVAICRLFEMKEYRAHAVTKVIKTSFLKDDLLFPLNKYYEDLATVYKWLSSVNTILLVPEILYNYVENENSITKESFSHKQFDLWNNCISINYDMDFTNEQRIAYTGFVYRSYVDICRVLSNTKRDSQKKYIKIMKKDINELQIKSLVYKVKKRNKYFWSFIMSYHFPIIFMCFYKLYKKVKSRKYLKQYKL